MATSQHRCVFVGNIPYDATEEQLVEICQEVGPVVSFRLVIDRETGKPKGYGFCEYKDEETALSARRNLQGYDINGRQLRVDFAENDKGLDRGREQGRGGPGLPPSADPPKKAGPATMHGDSALHQPIGPQIASTAQAVMAGALGCAQGQLASTNDPLTLHLAKFSTNQLNEIISEMKLMATQNKESARQLLLARPQLSKALFQAQIMLGMVTPQVLQMPNLVQNSLQSGLLPKAQEGQLSNVPQNARTQFPTPLQLPSQPLGQIQQKQPAMPGFYSTFPPLQSHSSSIPHIQALNQKMQLPTFQNPPAGSVTLGHNTQIVHSNVTLLPRQSLSDTRYQPGSSIPSGTSQPMSNNTNTNLPLRLAERATSMEFIAPPTKILKTGDATKLKPTLNPYNVNGSTPPQVSGVASSTSNAIPKLETLQSRKQISQPQVPSGVEPGLLQQVLSLTPEQLRLLPAEQQQQVMQLQQMLRQQQTQPS